MKKISLILMFSFGLSGCHFFFLDRDVATAEQEWTQYGYSLDLVKDIFYIHCGYRHIQYVELDNPEYKEKRIKVDKCMLDLGFRYMNEKVQYNETTNGEQCEAKDSAWYDFPSCQSYRKEMSKWPKSWLRLFE